MAAAMTTLLFCFAHPDDESFSGAGTAMRYAAAGARTVLITATLGQQGKCGDPPVCTPEELPRVREGELRQAAEIIGFDELHLLGYEDQRLADAPDDVIRRSLVEIIRRLQPQVVLTFDPGGFNAHPDHIAISRFTSDAIAAATDPRWYPEGGEPHTVERLLWTPLLAPWEAAGLADPSANPGTDFAIDVSPWHDRRVAALRAHRTQHQSIERYFFQAPNLPRILATEVWRQAWGPPLLERPGSDLLAGLSGLPAV
jgi:LmbE family N-acetylglucosaminyl deacetylase